MQAYRVGGSVRDELLGLPVADRDWVVVGATPQQMIDLGFKPVGRDFPVFLHPRTREEYALARTERKTGPGYRGFAVHYAPGVTLEEDLARRDLTINAIAKAEDGGITDPFDGRRDLQDRVLRHVSESFVEDPVRILRVARFAARFADFNVAPETMALMRRMTAAGEVDALVAERVWQELSRGLRETRPSRMMAVLREAGALHVLLPELAEPAEPLALPAPLPGGPGAAAWEDWLAALDRCAASREPLPVCYAVFASRARPAGAGAAASLAGAGAPATGPATAGAPASGAPATADSCEGADPAAAVLRLSQRLRAPADCRELAALLLRESQAAACSMPGAGFLDTAAALEPPALLQVLERCDAWRRPERLDGLLHAAAALIGADPQMHAGTLRLRQSLDAANAVDQAAIATRLRDNPGQIRNAIGRERLRMIGNALRERPA